MPDPRVRTALPADVPAILGLVRDLATYEKAPQACVATEADFEQALFPAHGHPTTFCHVAEAGGRVVGIALYFLNFSTWTGRNGIWLEDLYVEPQHRGSGLGKALLLSLAEVCAERGYPRLEWTVLDWNQPSIDFYRSLGAEPLEEWTTYRLDGADLESSGRQ
ncbi:L-amino acid N-acyltransferase YncA [Raineyella antarctica]|uniref:L-amino acid N-acyltransferase YncA n=1 Tax=Raineyella antarctica TaxID=1577474 RepID=A0A1G6GG90_9ACTN|nr:GNAT family N-acetyltransferase [Raineyella antarctica]SDB81007.1 L-amino acid N-acyltransferase YncA [Raineyella antarctica]